MTNIYWAVSAAALTVLLFHITDGKIKNICFNPYFLIIAAGAAARLMAARIDAGFQTDVDCFRSWVVMLYEDGFGAFYSSPAYTDYPPGYMYVLYVFGLLHSVFDFSYETQVFLIKTPAMAADVITAVCLYRLARDKIKPPYGLLIALLYALNPAVLVNSSVWGQVDAVHTLVIWLSLSALPKNKYKSFVLFAVSVLIKPQSLMFSPIYLYFLYKRLSEDNFGKESVAECLRLAASCLAVFVLLALPFTKNFNFTPVFGQFVSTITSYPYATVNAYNLYALLGLNWFPLGQSPVLMGIFGVLSIALIASAGFYLLKRDDSPGGVFFTAAFINICVFMFTIKMHERYVFPALAMLTAAYVHNKNRRLPFLYAGFSLTLFVNCADILSVYSGEMDYSLIDHSAPVVSAVNVILAAYLIYAAFVIPPGAGQTERSASAESADGIENADFAATKYNKTDAALLGSLFVVYTAVAFINLGNLKSPVTYWRGDAGAEIIADFGANASVREFMCLPGARAEKTFTLSFSDDGVYWRDETELTAENVFAWQADYIGVTGRYAKLTSMSDELYLMEAAFIGDEGRALGLALLSPGGAELFDEQGLLPGAPNYMNSTYFDEIYHPRTAYEFVHGLTVYETTHPPLGKVIISLGVRMFGMTPFGWRFMGTLFGCLMIPLMYCFARRMFGNPWWACFAAFVFAFDFMHFTQTRLATIDTYVVFFIMAMYYFMYKYSKMNFYDGGVPKTLVPLCLSGVCFGLAAASKWQGVYAAAGLAAVLCYTLHRRYKERRGGFIKKTAATLASCAVFFIIVPAAIYIASYIPYLRTEGAAGFKTIIDSQVYMYRYHSEWVLGSTHPYASEWWTWPLMLKPIFYYSNELPDGMKQGISGFGNPAVWWVGAAAFFYAIAALYKRTENKFTLVFLLIAFTAQYLPWVPVSRTTYIYHYFPCVPFIVLMTAYMFKERISVKYTYTPLAYCSAVLLLFILFYPVISGLPVSGQTVDMFLKWLPSWVLVR